MALLETAHVHCRAESKHKCQKRPTYTAKEPPLCQKRPTHMARILTLPWEHAQVAEETSVHGNSNLFTWQQRPTHTPQILTLAYRRHVSEGSYPIEKRDLFIWQNSPTPERRVWEVCVSGNRALLYGKRDLFIQQNSLWYLSVEFERVDLAHESMHKWQKRPTYMAKETYLQGRRASDTWASSLSVSISPMRICMRSVSWLSWRCRYASMQKCQKSPIIWQNRPAYMAKETYHMAKETYNMAKEAWLS